MSRDNLEQDSSLEQSSGEKSTLSEADRAYVDPAFARSDNEPAFVMKCRSIEPEDINILAGPGEANITLTKGYIAIVDADRYVELSQYQWHANVQKRGRKVYAARTIRIKDEEGKVIRKFCRYMHQDVMGEELQAFEPGDVIVDHESGNGLDNRENNLSVASHSLNLLNRPIFGVSSKYRGVSWQTSKRRWRALIAFRSKRQHIGYYKEEATAAAEYDAELIILMRKHFPEVRMTLLKSLLNFPEDHREVLERLKALENKRLAKKKDRAIKRAKLEEEIPF